jgi:hypothetical protein
VKAPILVAIPALALATSWWFAAARRTGAERFGFATYAGLLLIYVAARLSPLSAQRHPDLDATVAIAAAFFLHFCDDLIRRAKLTALLRPAEWSARYLPLLALAAVSWDAVVHDSAAPTLVHALMAETVALLYTLSFRRRGPALTGLAATLCGNLGLSLLWLSVGRSDALYYTIPVGASMMVLARVYRANLTAPAHTAIRITGCLLIYVSTYYQVVQFDHGSYALLLGAATLVGVAVGFWLQLRDLFLLSVGFAVLNVISNLTFYGVHRPLLGWALLTLAGLGLTASGVLFQLRRAQIRDALARVRARWTAWG